ncbi:MAG: BrnA antitoxin family protein [Bdellovibrionota bacterium]
MDNEVDFTKATRRLLFRRNEEQPAAAAKIPGAGKSAAERPERHVRVKVTMNLDGDVLSFFKDRAKEDGRPYQTLINQVLREYVSGSRPERIAQDVAEILLTDEAFVASLAQKLTINEK